MLHDEENNITSYFGPMKISSKEKGNSTYNMSQKKRFLAEIIKIIFKKLKWVLLFIFHIIYIFDFIV